MNKQRWHKIRRGIKYPILIFFLRVFVRILRFIPRRPLLAYHAFLARIAFRLVRKERVKTLRNLTEFFGQEKTPKEIYKMGEEVFVNQTINFTDYIRTSHYTKLSQFTFFDIIGEENLRKEYDKGKGVICLLSHTGAWEFSAILPPLMGYTTSAVSKSLSNPAIDGMIVEARELRGMKNITRGGGYKILLEHIEKGDCFIIMIDQDTKTKGVFVDFFGKKAFTPLGAALLAKKTGAPVLPMFMRRTPQNRYEFTIQPAIPYVETGDDEVDFQYNTQQYTTCIEKFIRAYPTQWVWMHERWKRTEANVEKWSSDKKIVVEKIK
ncbi:MAG: lysophospholipid acyltransferase family protein [Bacteroidales bacterium]|jgi:KDO2-lipid IV(A) lauroyltransferase|nr:lysophospholipid acyltransferase family protein [Bacteroidales bacterium]